MRLIYTKPKLKDLSQGSRIAFVRQFRFLTQDDVSDKLGLTGDCKRRTMTRYEKGDRNPKDERLTDVPNINELYIVTIKKFYDEWNIMRNKRLKREISYKEYIEWKLNYDLKEVGGLYGKDM